VSVDVITFGCRLNAYESEVIRRHAEQAGLSDVVVVNTCAVTGEAVRQARQAIRKLRRERPQTKLIVTGCAAQTEPESFADMPEVDRVLGNDEKMRADAWQDTHTYLFQKSPFALDAEEKIVVNDIMAVTETAAHLINGLEGRARAFVQVQNGCDHRCTFCIIPYGRGNSRSVPMGDVVTQIQRLVENGYLEVVLTGVDLTSYGANLPGTPKLGRLVQQILKHVPDLRRLRLSSIDSVEVDHDLLDAFANDERLMPHLHLSLQAGDDIILKRMKRRHSRADAISFCDQIRRLRPDVVFGGDIIAGFPTETEEMFVRSLELVEECGLVHLHIFPFSPRRGTPAARMPQVKRDIIKERARRLRAKGHDALSRRLDRELGSERAVLVETSDSGRTQHFIPVRLSSEVEPGTILNRTIIGRAGQQLLAV
jgi:threonylcarbamoyladenosine tRNA methylthiotransferase MtaB